MNTWTDAEQFKAITDRIQAMVDKLNRTVLGVGPGDWDNPKITFGYTGNDNDVIWSVFLPHPGRPGTAEDRIGYFRNNDLAGARATLNGLAGFAKGISFSRGSVMAKVD